MHPILRIFVYQIDASLSDSGSCDSIGASVAKVGAVGDSVDLRTICRSHLVRHGADEVVYCQARGDHDHCHCDGLE